MPFSQRDIVKVKVLMPDGKELTHPFLIISCELANSHEDKRCYLGVMMTHSDKKDRFTLRVTKEMFETHWDEKKLSQIRLHIITRFMESDISRDITHYVGKMKQQDFKAVVEQIGCFVIYPDK